MSHGDFGEFRNSFAACMKLLTIETMSEECRLKHTGTPTRGLAAL